MGEKDTWDGSGPSYSGAEHILLLTQIGVLVGPGRSKNLPGP